MAFLAILDGIRAGEGGVNASNLPQSPQTAPAPLPVPRLSPERARQDQEDSRCLRAIRPVARKCRDLSRDFSGHTYGDDIEVVLRKSRALEEREEADLARLLSDRHLSTPLIHREGRGNSGRGKECSPAHPAHHGGYLEA